METTNKVKTIKTDLVNLPNLAVAAGNDSFRPVMKYVYFNWDGDSFMIVSTNAHFLVYCDLFSFIGNSYLNEFKELYPNGFYIHSDYFKPLTDKKAFSATFETDKITVHIHNKNSINIPIETVEKVGKYPNWKAVIPETSQAVTGLNFNAEFLSFFQKLAKDTCINFEFNERSASKFGFMFNNTYIRGLICPIGK